MPKQVKGRIETGHIFLSTEGFPGGPVVKNLPGTAGDAGDTGLMPGLGRFPGVGNGNPLQYSCLENPRDRKSTRLNSSHSGQSRMPSSA